MSRTSLPRRLGQWVSAVRRHPPRPASRSPRHEYKVVWDAVSHTEEAAKIAVAGYADEAELARTAGVKLGVIREAVGVRPDDVVLEIGAGVGRLGRAVAPCCAEWVGADVSANMLAHLRHRLADLPNVRTVELNGYDLGPVPSASVDLVYCTVVFMHLDEWERFRYVREGFRVLRPGGRMLVDNINLLCDAGWEHFEAALNMAPAERPPQVSKCSTPQELEAYFRRAGFARIGQQTAGVWVYTWGVKP